MVINYLFRDEMIMYHFHYGTGLFRRY